MSNLDTLINIGAAADWITPTLAFIDDWKYGPAAHFGMSPQYGYSTKDIKRILNANGIRVWGLMFNIDFTLMMFAVNVDYAQTAYDVLTSAGVPLDYVPTGLSTRMVMPETNPINYSNMASTVIMPITLEPVRRSETLIGKALHKVFSR